MAKGINNTKKILITIIVLISYNCDAHYGVNIYPLNFLKQRYYKFYYFPNSEVLKWVKYLNVNKMLKTIFRNKKKMKINPHPF